MVDLEFSGNSAQAEEILIFFSKRQGRIKAYYHNYYFGKAMNMK